QPFDGRRRAYTVAGQPLVRRILHQFENVLGGELKIAVPLRDGFIDLATRPVSPAVSHQQFHLHTVPRAHGVGDHIEYSRMRERSPKKASAAMSTDTIGAAYCSPDMSAKAASVYRFIQSSLSLSQFPSDWSNLKNAQLLSPSFMLRQNRTASA